MFCLTAAMFMVNKVLCVIDHFFRYVTVIAFGLFKPFSNPFAPKFRIKLKIREHQLRSVCVRDKSKKSHKPGAVLRGDKGEKSPLPFETVPPTDSRSKCELELGHLCV